MNNSQTALELPNKPSDLIEVALQDLERVEKDPRYVVDMYKWHSPNGLCKVCLAGAVMSRVVEPTKWTTPSELFDATTADKLKALDEFRTGSIRDALIAYFSFDIPDDIPKMVDVPLYKDDRDGFFEAMRGIVKLLRKYSL
jgi:hypothetical protein